MVLIAGIPSEPPVQLALESLQKLQIPFLMLNQRKFKKAHLQWSLNEGVVDGVLTYQGKAYSLSEFTGVYIRFMDEQSLPELKGLPASHKDVAYFQQLQATLIDWMEVADCKVVNRYSAMASNNSKSYQSLLIAQTGFRVPTTLITNQPEEVESFLQEHDEIIYKSISGIRSIVKKFDDADQKRIGKIKNCPIQFQHCVKGFDVRVHVIGDTATATRVDSSDTDYRYYDQDEGYTVLNEFELPPDVHYHCLELARHLSLDFCGIDLRFPNEESDTGSLPWCFEVNPCPGYSYYQKNTGQTISDILAAYLGNHNYYYQESYNLT